MRPPLRLIEPARLGVSIATRGDCAGAPPRGSRPRGAPGGGGTVPGTGAAGLACGGLAPGIGPAWPGCAGAGCWPPAGRASAAPSAARRRSSSSRAAPRPTARWRGGGSCFLHAWEVIRDVRRRRKDEFRRLPRLRGFVTMPSARRRSSIRRGKSAVRMSRRPITTTSALRSRWSTAAAWIAFRRRRLIRLRSVAWPTFLVTVSPKRKPAMSSRQAPLHRHPLRMKAAARGRRQEVRSFGQPPRPWNGRRLRAPVAHSRRECLRGQALAAMRPARGDDLAAALRRHAGAKAMPALADELARLIGPLHGSSPAARQAEGCARDCLTDCSGKNDERPEGAPPRGAHMAEQAAEVNVSQQRGRGA